MKQKITVFVSLFLLVLLTLTTSACGAKRVAGWEVAVETKGGDLMEVLAKAQESWQKREDPRELERAITLYEQAISIQPNQLEVLTQLARAYYFLADGYRRNDPENQLLLYDKSAVYGEKAMALHPEFLKKVKEEGVKPEDAVTVLTPEYLPAVYWTASAVGRWARLKGFTTLLAQRNRVKKLMDWVTEKNPTFFYGGPYRYWGAFYALSPAFAGGDLKKSREYFEKSLEVEPNYFGTKVLMADTYAIKVQDRELYVKLLNEVIAGSPEVLPDIIPEQKVEQAKAKDLLALADERFAGLGLSLGSLARIFER
jgi:tetratricopeptide (TPR) repeat protein